MQLIYECFSHLLYLNLEAVASSLLIILKKIAETSSRFSYQAFQPYFSFFGIIGVLNSKECDLQGTIVKALAGFYYVESDGHIYQTRARGKFRKKGQTPYVGDQVEFSAEENSEGYILSIAPRKNSLVRPPIVNIDQAVVIMSAKEPDFNANLLDRFLVLLEHKGIHPIVYISKLDLLEDMEDIHYYQGIYQAIGYDFVLSIEELLPLLTNQTTVFMGQTGVGKSTLLNKIAPDLELETGEISDSLGRGRHTTRAVSFYHLNGGKIADTPGFSSLDYEVTTSEDLNQAFPEIADVSHSCKFRTCTHTHEPACAVKPAVEREEIATFRYEDYLQFLSEIENRRETYKKVSKKMPK